jgi:hypothetical protein
MPQWISKFTLGLSFCLCLSMSAGCSEGPQDAATGGTENAMPVPPATVTAGEPNDIIARVEDQYITFSQINTALNSAAVVGVSIPTFGTKDRDVVRMTLLDKLISANLIYLDALDKGVDKDPAYLATLEKFSNAVLASVYRNRYLADKLTVSDEEIEAFYKSSKADESDFNDDMKTAIEAVIRKKKLNELQANMSAEIRQGHTITINDAALSPEGEQERDDAEVVATLDGEQITWAEVKSTYLAPVSTGSMDKRRALLNGIIDKRIILQAAKAADMQEDPQYKQRVGEFRKTSLINFYRKKLMQEMEPTEAEISAYYDEYGDRIRIPEARKVQMVLVKTREEAEDIKQKIESGELTLPKAAALYSIVPDADKNLGEIGWVDQGTGFPALDELTFSLAPNEIGGPVETPAGWHLVMVQDQRDPSNVTLDSPGTREKIRAGMVEDRLDNYTVDLRLNKYNVEVYKDVITQLATNEAEWFRDLSEKSEKSGHSQEELLEQIKSMQR